MTDSIFMYNDIFGEVKGVVYHYISPNTFEKVISNQELWFTRCDCLNDYEDGEVLGKLCKDCLEELHKSKSIDQEFFDVVSSLKISHSAWRIEKDHAVHLPCKPYVCCFSQDEDSLQMWQYYSKVGNYEGYNIGFAPKEMLNVDTAFFSIGKVVYGESEQVEHIKHIIKQSFNNYCVDLHERKESNTNKTVLLKRHAILLNNELAKLACFFKRECFAGEKEIRIVLEVPIDAEYRDKFWMKNKNNTYPTSTKYRIQHAMMIPYIVVNFNPDSIKSVMIGPVTSTKDNSMKKNKEVVEEFLHDRLGRTVPVSTSKIPVRY